MRTRLRSKVTLLFLTIAVLLAVPAVAALAQDTSISPAPTIQSDKADYAPGELVTLTGSGWQAGELVHINVNDAQGQTWSRDADVTADASGNITDSFNLPNSFISDYDVTATGAQSGTATTTFTDSQPQSVSVFPTSGTVPQPGFASSPYSVTVQMGGNSNDCTVTLGIGSPPGSNDTGLPSGVTPHINPPFTGNVTYSTGLVFITNFATPPGTYTFHVKATPGANCEGNGDIYSTQQLTLVVNSGVQATNTTVTSSSNPSTYGNNVTFTATVNSSAGSPTAGQGTVTFKDGPNAITGCSNAALDSNSQATCTTSALNVAGSPYSITAEYSGTSSGSPQFQASTSSALSQTVDKAPTTTTVTCGAGPFTYNGSAHEPCSAEVSGPGGLNLTPDVVYANNINAGTATASASYDESANYNGSSDTKTFTITKRPITVTALSDTKVYDGTISSSKTPTVTGGIVSGDQANFSQAFDTKNVGQNKTLTPSGSVNDNNDGNNYQLEFVNNTNGEITAKELTASFTAENKVYDGNDSANIAIRTLQGVVGNEDVSLDGGTAKFNDKNVANGKTVTATGFTLAGTDKDNYKLEAGPWTTTADINPAPLTVTADNQSKKLGDPNPTFTASTSGFVNGEDKSVLGGTLTFTTNVPSPEQVGTWDITPSGLTSSNYSINFVKGTLTITSITYNFSGFRSPVDNPGTGATPVYNSAKAGQSIPVKFGLGGNQGLNIIAAGYPKVTSVNCVSSATVDPIEEYATSTANGGLTYEATADQYNYIWKTQSTYVNKCYKFDLQLTDGTSHVAYFKFLK